MGYFTSEIRFLNGALFIRKDKLKEFEKERGWKIGSELRLKEMDGGPKQILHRARDRLAGGRLGVEGLS